MPLPKGTRYRWKTYPSGKKVRLAFRKGTNTVIETKSSTGATHTPEEFAKDKRMMKSIRGSGSFSEVDLLKGYKKVQT